MKFFHDGTWFFLVPGFVALFVAGFISDFPTIGDAQLAVVYVTLTLVSGALPLLVFHMILRRRREQLEVAKIVWNPWFFCSVIVTAVVLGLVIGILYTTDRVSSSLRSIFGPQFIPVVSHSELMGELFTRAYGEGGGTQGMWDGRPYFRHNTSSHYIRIMFQGESVALEGVAEKWSGRKSKPQVYLSPACEVVRTTVKLIKGPGVWVNLEGVRQIQFVDDVCSPCATALEILAKKTPSTDCPYRQDIHLNPTAGDRE